MGLLDGKKAVIAGVANHMSIAWGIARSFHEQGARLIILCHPKNMRRVRKLTEDINIDALIPCDIQSDEEINDAFNVINTVFEDKLDILVHSIAYAKLEDIEGEFMQVSRAGWNLALEISAYSLVALARRARPLLRQNGGGSIITLTFEGGKRVVPGYNVMGVAKAALDMSVRYLAYDLGPENIRVNAISAGPISTVSSRVVENFQEALRMVAEHSPLMRNISQEDIANAAIYLASDLSGAVTGAIMPVDAGMNIMFGQRTSNKKKVTG